MSRPGVAYRRPGGDPDRLVVEAVGETRLDVDALPRSDWLTATTDDDRERLRAALADQAVDVTYRIDVGGEQQWVREYGQTDDDGDIVGYLLPASDRVEQREQLERQHERLKEFASVVSHDLRTPLTVAVGNVELAKESAGEEATEQLERAHDALNWMDDLISDLLALAREGRSVDETSAVDLRRIVEDAWGTAGRGSRAALVIDGQLPVVVGDRRRLREVLENLFRNAIEHGTPTDRQPDDERADVGTDEAGHGIFVLSNDGDRSADQGDGTDRLGARSPDAAALRVFVGALPDGFYVADDGAGIEPSVRESIFEPGHSTADDGTGFGLPIVERIAEAHGWSVAVTESRTGGARFEFTGVDTSVAPEFADSDRGAEGPDRTGPRT